MSSKRRFKEDENCESTVNKKFHKETTHLNGLESNDVELVVKDLVSKLINETVNANELIQDNGLSYRFIELQTNEYNNKGTEANQITEIDDSIKLNYDFSSLNNDYALYNSQFNNSFDETNLNSNATTSSTLVLNLTANDHNYANVSSINPTTSQSSSLNPSSSRSDSGQSNIVRPLKSALKIKKTDAIKITNSSASSNKKNVKFKNVNVFYFSRNQGGSTVPSQGGSSLGMEMNHCDTKNFTLDSHQEEKRQVHREILLRQKRYERMYQKQLTRLANLDQSDSDEDSLENISDISDSELDFDSWYFLQPVPVKQRRALLRESGISKIDSSDKEQCRYIRLSREYCGCECRVFCDPETCQCSLNGIKCQVDRLNFPCGCARDSCNNLNGRTEFNPVRVRTHFIHTIMRLELEKKNETQQFNDELNSASSSNHLKSNLSNHEIMNQNTFSSNTLTNNQQTQMDQYEIKFQSDTAIQSNEPLYALETPNNSNILNCTVDLQNDNNNYDLYDSADTGSSSYSESSECTSEDLDCGLGLNNLATTSNALTFSNLSPFSINVPTTNTETLSYDNQYFQFADQTFRYFSSSINNNVQTDPNLILNPSLNQPLNQTTTNGHQLINNHHLNTYYYQGLTTVDCYAVTPDLNKSMLNGVPSSSLSYEQTASVDSAFINEVHHYTDLTDLSQSIASKSSELFTSSIGNNPINHFDLDCTVPQSIEPELNELDLNSSTVVNSSSDDSSSSAQSLNANHLDNYLMTNGESVISNDEDNFGEIIKNTVLESVTA